MELSSAVTDLGDHGSVTLADGRSLGYARFGAEGGAPVLAFNGTPGSRWFGAFFEDVARETGRSIIALERPGYGRSDPLDDRHLREWPDDVAEATTALGIDEFGIVAFSGGAPHALACGSALSDRVTGIALSSPAGPPSSFENRTYRAILWLAKNAPRVLSILVSGLARFSRGGEPEQIAPKYIGSAVLDVEVAAGVTAAEIAYADFVGASRNGTEGAVAELRMLARPWDIDVANVAVPVECWHSDADDEVPLAATRALCDEIPDSTLHVRAGEHHGAVTITCRADLLDAASPDGV